MKITTENRTLTRVSDLSPGDCFLHDNELNVVLDLTDDQNGLSGNRMVVCVSLNNSLIRYVPISKTVRLVDVEAKVTLK